MTLDRVAAAGLGVDGAVGLAQPTAAKDLARVLGRDGLVWFARGAVEVENELVRRGQAAVPVAGQTRALIPDMVPSTLLTLIVIPAVYGIRKGWRLAQNAGPVRQRQTTIERASG